MTGIVLRSQPGSWGLIMILGLLGIILAALVFMHFFYLYRIHKQLQENKKLIEKLVKTTDS
ncbi:MAG: hypothetical protein ACOWWO_12430 [Peptococcaceae bacterium]